MQTRQPKWTTYIVGVLKISNTIWVIFFWLGQQHCVPNTEFIVESVVPSAGDNSWSLIIFLTNFNIWPTKIHFGWPILLSIFNGMAINNLQNVLSSKNGWLISNPYFYHCMGAKSKHKNWCIFLSKNQVLVCVTIIQVKLATTGIVVQWKLA